MDKTLRADILEYSPDAIEYLRKLYGLDKPEVLDESINILQNWINKQDHFVKKDFGRIQLEWTILVSKGSIEKAKQKLDKYCTAKILYPRMFEKLDAKNDFTNFDEYHAVVLPKFTDDFYRVMIIKLRKLNKNPFPFLDLYRYLIIICECMRSQYFNGAIVIIDYSEVDVMEVLKIMSLPTLQEFATIGINCFGLRLKGIYLITASNVIGILMSIAKQIVSAKLIGRIKVLKTYQPLQAIISPKILPVDYGGEEKSLKELNEMWINFFSSEDVTKYVKEMQEYRTDESRRQLIEFNNEYMGTPGSFRSFVVD